jgi:hypothetical protein
MSVRPEPFGKLRRALAKGSCYVSIKIYGRGYFEMIPGFRRKP